MRQLNTRPRLPDPEYWWHAEWHARGRGEARPSLGTRQRPSLCLPWHSSSVGPNGWYVVMKATAAVTDDDDNDDVDNNDDDDDDDAVYWAIS